jgi:hypothetical protein
MRLPVLGDLVRYTVASIISWAALPTLQSTSSTSIPAAGAPSTAPPAGLVGEDVDVCRRALRKHFVDTVDLYIDGTRGWSVAEADTRN